MKKRKIARFGYLLISALFCCMAFAIWLWPDYSPQAACCVSGTILLGYGVIRILGFFSDDSYCPAFHYDLACGLLFMVVGTNRIRVVVERSVQQGCYLFISQPRSARVQFNAVFL